MKIAVIIERLGPYHAARLRAAGERLGASSVVAIEVAASSSEYAWDPAPGSGFERVTLVRDRDYHSLSTLEIARHVYDALDAERPDAVAINGWAFPEARAGAMWCASRGKAAILMAESQQRDARRRAHRERIKAARVRAFDSALVGGIRHVEYVTGLGMERSRVVTGYDVVDNEHFQVGAEAARQDAGRRRAELGLPARYLLAIGRFIPKKNFHLLVEAFGLAFPSDPGRSLVILGDGPERPRLEALVGRLGLADRVSLPGFRQYSELPSYLGLAEAFVLPSTVEQWGLVVNEAMASGLPVVVSEAAGSAELVQEGRNGFTFRPDDVEGLARVLRSLDDVDLAEMGRAARKAIEPWSPLAFARGLEEAARIGAAHRARRPRRRESSLIWAVPPPPRTRRPARTAPIVVIIERIGPYHAARLHALASAHRGGDVIAVEIAAKSKEYAWDLVDSVNCRRETLFVDREYQKLGADEITSAVERVLDAMDPSAVAINGWTFPEARASALWCARHSRPAVLMSASQERDAPRIWYRELVKRLRLQTFGAALVGGTRQAEYVVKLGMGQDCVVPGYDVIDNAHFARGADAARANAAAERRARGLPEAYLLCVSRLIEKKNLVRLVEAYASYLGSIGPGVASLDLVILGDGPQRSAIEAAIRARGLEGRVHLPGFHQYPELPVYYGLASGFVLPSLREQWGLVVNEAMAAGLPVLVSVACGSAGDLVREGENGFTFDPQDTGAIARAIAALASSDREALGRRSREIIASWTPATFAQGMLRCIDLARRATPGRRSLVNRLAWW